MLISPTSRRLTFCASGHSATGSNHREEGKPNQDNFLIFDKVVNGRKLGVFLVADGVGGGESGERASQLVKDTVEDVFLNASPTAEPGQLLIEALTAANAM